MAAISNVPREIESSMRDTIGSNIKIYIKRMVKHEVRPDKWEKRVIALAGCRFIILAAKAPTKVEQNISFLDIQAIESKKCNQLSLTVDNKTLNFVTLDAETEEIDLVVTHIGRSIKNVFPAFPVERIIKKIDVQPPDRLRTMNDLIKGVEHKETGPCGGFSIMYACMCDYHNLPYREEVAWDVDTIYLSQDSRELCLQDFDHLNSKDLIPIVGALEHNVWFTKLNVSDVKLNFETQCEILKVMKHNAVIEELCLSNTGISGDFVTKLATAVLSNTGSQLTSVDLSKNSLTDASLVAFIGSLGNLSKGLVSFNIASTSVSGKGLNKIADTLSQNQSITHTLQNLNMSENRNPKGEDIQCLYNFLAQPNNLTYLNLSGIDCSLESLCGALLRGSCPTLTHLYLSRNMFSYKKGKEVIVQGTWKTFFSSVYGLETLDLSGCKIPPEALKELLLGIASNIHIKNLHLDLSNNDLQSAGGTVLGGSLAHVQNVTSLDISNNGFDQALVTLLDMMKSNKSIKHLAFGGNFTKVKNYPMVLESVVNLIQDENSAVESLSLADSKLKNQLSVIINALGSNTSLTEIDISGNNVGDLGARMLSKALQINNNLKTIKWDKNNTTAQGFEDIANALKKNFTVKKMPTPLMDVSRAIVDKPERTEAAIQAIESILQRNHSPQKYSSDQAYRLQQGFLISSTQQMVDRLVVQVQDTINALSMGPGTEFQSDIDKGSSIVKDADNSKQLLPQLQNIAMRSCDDGNPVDKQIQQISIDLKDVLMKQMKKSVSDMVECTSNQCAAITSDQKFMEDLVSGCAERSSLPPHFSRNVLDSVETSVYNKLSELNLAVAAYISDTTVDGVIEALHVSHKTLTNHLNKKKSEMAKLRDDKSNKDKENQEKANEEENDKPMMRESKITDSPLSTPDLTTKRKTIHGRKQRPPTVVDAEQVKKALMIHESKSTSPSSITESDLEQRSEVSAPEVRGHDPMVPLLKSGENGTRVDSHESLDRLELKPEKPALAPLALDDLPALPTVQLQNDIAKGRARGPQNRRRPKARPQPANDAGESGMKEDEGLDSFFQTKTVTPAISAAPSQTSSVNSAVTKPEKKESSNKQKPPEKPSKPEEPSKKKGLFGFGKKTDTPEEKKKGGFSLFTKKKNQSRLSGSPSSTPESKPLPPSQADKPTNSNQQEDKRKESVTSVKEDVEQTETKNQSEETSKTGDNQNAEVLETTSAETPEEEEEAKDVVRQRKPVGGIGMMPNMGNVLTEMKRYSQVQREKDARRPGQAILPPPRKKSIETGKEKADVLIEKKEKEENTPVDKEKKVEDTDVHKNATEEEKVESNLEKKENLVEEKKVETTEDKKEENKDEVSEKEDNTPAKIDEKQEDVKPQPETVPTDEPETEKEEKKEDKKESVKEKNDVESEKAVKEEESENKRHSILKVVQTRPKPAPAPRTSGNLSRSSDSKESIKTGSSSSLSSNSSRASDELKPKPSPPVKPRPPPKTAPKPKAGAIGDRDSNTSSSSDVADSNDKSENAGADSANLRLSVGEKIKRLSQNLTNMPLPVPDPVMKRRSQNFSARPPSAELPAAKSSSLPRDTNPPRLIDGNAKDSAKESNSNAKDSAEESNSAKTSDSEANNDSKPEQKDEKSQVNGDSNSSSPEAENKGEEVIMV